MENLDESKVSVILSEYLYDRGLSPLGKKSPFTHADDIDERSFEIDLAIGPCGTLGRRTQQQTEQDNALFCEHSKAIDPVVNDLRRNSLFPNDHDSMMSWNWQPNPNPIYGVAIEIENNLSKYFLGSLLAAAIAGRWGILIVPAHPSSQRWIETIRRMMHKGSNSPIPSNISIYSWPTLLEYINKI